jgi:hypothetical protein
MRKLIVDADAVLTPPRSFQWFQHKSRWLAEIVEARSRIHPVQFPPGYTFKAARCMFVSGGTVEVGGDEVREFNRRNFLRAASAASAGTLLAPGMHALSAVRDEALQDEPAKPVAANDHIQIALIGAGGQGQGDTKTAVQVPGVKLRGCGRLLQRQPRARQRDLGSRHLHHAGLQRDSRPQRH